MAEYMMNLMKQAAVFTIVAQTILHFRPNKSYEKYLKMLIGMMLLAVFIIPLTELFAGNSTVEYKRMLEGYEKSIDTMYEQSDFTINLKEETYLYTIQEEIKERFNNISKEYGYRVENVNLSGIQENYEAGGFRDMLKDGYVEVILEKQNGRISTIEVDKIKLKDNKTETIAEAAGEALDEKLLLLQRKFAESIGIAESSVRMIRKGQHYE